MLKWFRMKKAEWAIKSTFYEAIIAFIDNKKDIMQLSQNIFNSLKGVPVDELRGELISKIAELIHESNLKPVENVEK